MAQINKSSDYFNTVLYTGTGSELAVTGVGFQPDWTWIKRRDAIANGGMFDNVRGATKLLSSSQTDAEQTLAQSLKSFDSDGFTLGTGTNGYVNTSGSTTVAWNWLASNTTASNTDGSITSTVSANTTSGFSIVSYTGTNATGTVGHGLGATPKIVLYKNRTDVTYWYFTTSIIDGTHDLLLLPATDAQQPFSASLPTSSVLNLIANNDTNGSGDDIIAYCFAEKKGFSKFGSYIGNGSTDGTFVYTGFKPAMVIMKRTSASGTNWQLIDNKRSDAGGNNVIDKVLSPNASDAEYDEGSANWFADFVSNGFKIRNSFSASNSSGATYIYMAFAESPLVGTNNIPAVAR